MLPFIYFFLLLFFVGSSIGLDVCWGVGVKGWIGYGIAGGLWFLGTLGMQVFVAQEKKVMVWGWGVPFVPWLPSVSIADNVFLMGSLGYQAFVRFGVCTGLMLVYYFLFGVHATYDAAQEFDDEGGIKVVCDQLEAD